MEKNDWNCKVTALIDGKEISLPCQQKIEDHVLTLTVFPACACELKSAWLETEFLFSRKDHLFLNGYQSWTDSREHSCEDRFRGLHGIPSLLIRRYAFDAYGDYSFTKYPNRKGMLHGYTYAYVRREDEFIFWGSLSEKQGFTRIWLNSNSQNIRIEKECQGMYLCGETKLFQIYMGRGSEEEVFSEYFSKMNLSKPQGGPVTGYTTWYDCYENIDEKLIHNQLNVYKKSSLHPQIFQIDDGYETAVGDWLEPDQDKFPSGMKVVATKIRENGMIPGLWLAPFSCKTNSKLAKEHPEWLVRNDQGKALLCGNNWGGFYGLDLEQEEVKQYLIHVFNTVIHEWGYTFLKLDFLYSTCLWPRGGKSRGQLMCEAMEFIRANTKGALLLGCGVPLGAAFGKIDYCRIGCDVSLEFDDVWWMRRFHRERASTKNTIENTIYRRQLDGKAFFNDPDVYLLRERNTKMSEKEKDLLLGANVHYGSLLFTSDNPLEYSAETLKKAEKAERAILAKRSIWQKM